MQYTTKSTLILGAQRPFFLPHPDVSDEEDGKIAPSSGSGKEAAVELPEVCSTPMSLGQPCWPTDFEVAGWPSAVWWEQEPRWPADGGGHFVDVFVPGLCVDTLAYVPLETSMELPVKEGYGDFAEASTAESEDEHSLAAAPRGQVTTASVAASGNRPAISASQRRRQQRLRAAARSAEAAATRSKSPGSSAASLDDAKCLRSTPTASSDAPRHSCISGSRSETMQALDAGGERRSAAIASLRGAVVRESFSAEGCRTVQRALEVGTQQESIELAWELQGHVRDALESPFANHVIQRIVMSLPPSRVDFIVAEISGLGVVVARSRFGCRILNRLLEHAGSDSQTAALIDEVLVDAENLCLHQFGHYVMEEVLEHGMVHQQSRVAKVLLRDVVENAKHRNGSHVFEKALMYAPAADRMTLAEELLAAPEGLADIGRSQFGTFVVSALLAMRGEVSDWAKERVWAAEAELQGSKYGKRILANLGRKDMAYASRHVD